MNSEDLKNVEFFVEAGSFAVQKLWEEFNEMIKWEQISPCPIITIGQLQGRPIVVCFSFVRLNGHLIAFWEPTSQLVDHEMIDNWFKKEGFAPKWDNGTRLAFTDDRNFHHCYKYCRDGK